MSNDYLKQGDYYTSLYRLHQLTNQQLREERLLARRGPSLMTRILNWLGKREDQPAVRYPRRWRTRPNLS